MVVVGVIILGLAGTASFLFSKTMSQAEDIGRLNGEINEHKETIAIKEKEIIAAHVKIADINEDVGRMTERAERYADELADLEQEYARNVKRIQDTVNTTRDAIQRDPEKASRVLSYLAFRSMRNGCKESGADISTCDTRLREPETADTGAANNNEPDDVSDNVTQNGGR
jgi:phage host-nuclease inhibitor protein Gam